MEFVTKALIIFSLGFLWSRVTHWKRRMIILPDIQRPTILSNGLWMFGIHTIQWASFLVVAIWLWKLHPAYSIAATLFVVIQYLVWLHRLSDQYRLKLLFDVWFVHTYRNQIEDVDTMEDSAIIVEMYLERIGWPEALASGYRDTYIRNKGETGILNLAGYLLELSSVGERAFFGSKEYLQRQSALDSFRESISIAKETRRRQSELKQGGI